MNLHGLTYEEACKIKCGSPWNIMFPDCGFIYIFSNTCWPINVYKIGKARNISSRMRTYNGHQPQKVHAEYIFFVTNMTHIENAIKHDITPFRFQDQAEFVQLELIKLIEKVQSCMIWNQRLSIQFGFDVHVISTPFVSVKMNVERTKQDQEEEEVCFITPRHHHHHHHQMLSSSSSSSQCFKFFIPDWTSLDSEISEVKKRDITKKRKRKRKYNCNSDSPQKKEYEDNGSSSSNKRIKIGKQQEGIVYVKNRKCWRAFVQKNYHRLSITFRIDDYGFQGAKEKCEMWRQNMIQELDRKHLQGELPRCKKKRKITTAATTVTSSATSSATSLLPQSSTITTIIPKSKIKGVTFDHQHNGFLATIERKRKKKRKFFSVYKYGDEAWKKAKEWRQEMEAQMYAKSVVCNSLTKVEDLNLLK